MGGAVDQWESDIGGGDSSKAQMHLNGEMREEGDGEKSSTSRRFLEFTCRGELLLKL